MDKVVNCVCQPLIYATLSGVKAWELPSSFLLICFLISNCTCFSSCVVIISLDNSNRDDDIQDPDHATRISKLDISDPLHFHPIDTTALIVVSIILKGTENYQVWSCAMLLALEGKNKIDFIDGTCKGSNTDEILDDSYMQIRSFILSREVLPDVRSAYVTISSEESHVVTAESTVDSSQRNQASAFVSNVPYRQNIQRNNQNNSSGPSRHNNLNNSRQCGVQLCL
nr:ribonuclease H-like domain-containing protein [Tanacetum cinerariifolium]